MSTDRQPAGIEIERAVKRYGDVAAVDGVSLAVPDGAFVSLLGPAVRSGSVAPT